VSSHTVTLFATLVNLDEMAWLDEAVDERIGFETIAGKER
jgi:hypothetical protein